MADFVAQNADLARVVAAWIEEVALNVSVYDTYSDYAFPYIVVMPTQRGRLESQNEIHGRSPNCKVEFYADDYQECMTLQALVFNAFRHAKNVTKTVTDVDNNTHTIEFTTVTSYGGSQQVWETEGGFWCQDYYEFSYVEV